MNKTITAAFVGNPNCGKTSLFNAITGANLKVANYPGVTVERKEGHMTFGDCNFTLVDLPGTYALTCYTMEEIVTRLARSSRATSTSSSTSWMLPIWSAIFI